MPGSYRKREDQRYANRPPPRRAWLILAKLCILVLVGLGISRSIIRAWQDLVASPFSWEDLRWSWLAAAAGLYALAQIPMGWYWFRILRAFGQQPTWLEALCAFFVGHVGKYVPGKVLVVVIRAAMVRSERVDPVLAAASVFVETLTYMAVASFLAALVLLLRFRDQFLLQFLAAGGMAAMVLATLPPVLRRWVTWLQRRRGKSLGAASLKGVSGSLIASGWCLSLVAWTLCTLSLWATLKALPLAAQSDLTVDLWLHLMASVCLAVVAGFVSLLPGGLVAREWVLNELMAPYFGTTVAVVAAITLRVVWLLTEVAASTILFMTFPRAAARQP